MKVRPMYRFRISECDSAEICFRQAIDLEPGLARPHAGLSFVNFERAYDMDELVGKAYRGRVAWDQFAAVTSAHPVLMRRLDTPGDRAEYVFRLFLGRPPYEASTVQAWPCPWCARSPPSRRRPSG